MNRARDLATYMRQSGILPFESPDVPYTDVCWEDSAVRLSFAVRCF